MAEAELDALPRDTARAVRQLADYQWRSPEARETYEQIQELLRDEVLDAQFAGMRDAMQNATPQDMQRIREMMHALNEMLDADARGEHTQQQFDEFMQQLRRVLPGPSAQPRRADRLSGPAGRRRPAADGLAHPRAARRARVADGPGARRRRAGRRDGPAAAGAARRRGRTCPGAAARGWTAINRIGYADATGAIAELADLDQLGELLGQDYPGASLDDIDEELIERALGRQAVDDLAQLRRIERELREQGYLRRTGDGHDR